MKKNILLFGVLSSLFFFSGCSEKAGYVLQPEKIGSADIDYTEGYRDGCSAGYNTYIRNQKLYDFNKDYRYGWNKGYSDCLNKSLHGGN